MARVPRDKDRLEARQRLSEFSRQFAASQFRHDQIGEQQVNRAGMLPGHLDRILAVKCGQHAVAEDFQLGPDQFLSLCSSSPTRMVSEPPGVAAAAAATRTGSSSVTPGR